ncbi:MAG: hypothetical protein IPL49_00990 [Saprospirales bacterium]|nr:hypothetical protein [Saprospirales bacterium]MBK8489495.1 hypothetical protein [Saprospirales bacterium]
MCFSAGASFGASALLLGAGVATFSQARKPSEWALAGIPLFFSVQQFSEGLLWLALTKPQYAGWEGVSTYVFFFFAQIFWPVWIPLAVWLLEKKALREKVLRIFLAAGVLLAIYMIISTAQFGVEAVVERNHIRYGPKYPFGILRTVLYVVIVCGPFFISSYKKMSVFGACAIAALLVTILFYMGFMASVWCFFAALLSLLIWWILRQNHKPV